MQAAARVQFQPGLRTPPTGLSVDQGDIPNLLSVQHSPSTQKFHLRAAYEKKKTVYAARNAFINLLGM